MKKLIICMFVLLLSVGCAVEDVDSLKLQVDGLKIQRDSLVVEAESLRTEIDSLSQNKEYIQKISEGRDAKFMLSLELKQSHFSLDVNKHLKDAMNKLTFEIAVDEDLYNEQDVGSELLREFRDGSAWMEGSFGDWVVTVVDKRIIYLDEK